MRGSVLAMLFSVMCVSVSAEEAKQPSPLGSDDLWIRQSACKGVGDIAVTVMTQRQKQVPMSEMISRLQLAEGMVIYEGTGVTTSLSLWIIKEAYRFPRFTKPDLQNDMVAHFRNKLEALCFDGKFANMP